MSDKPIINRIEVTEFTVELENLGTDYNGFNIVYSPGEKLRSTRYALSIGTSVGKPLKAWVRARSSQERAKSLGQAW